MMVKNAKSTAILIMLGVLAVFSMSPTTGKPYTGNPGDCINPNANFVSELGGCRHIGDPAGVVWSRTSYAADANGDGVPGDSFQFAQAQAYCANLVEGGKSDWRLPTRTEMRVAAVDGGATIINGWVGYAISPFNSMSTYDHWTGNTQGKSVWVGHMHTNNTYTEHKTVTYSLLDTVCVRPPVE